MSIAEQDVEQSRAPRRSSALQRLSRRFGLRLSQQGELTIRRVKRGGRYRFVRSDGRAITDTGTLVRLKALAVPPAYTDVRYARSPRAHLQAIGRDAAGRLQYRYHPDWEKVRELRKARRLARLVDALPTIRRSVAQRLAADELSREFALSAVIELVARTAIRPGNDTYAKLHGSRGATTLLKSHVTVEGGKSVQKECDAPALVRAIERLRTLPGKRLFQYQDESGEVRPVTSTQVNAFLREIAGVRISCKDFRTLVASAAVMETLARVTPANSVRARNRQIMDAVRASADELANTPAICRKSYVHETIVTAFEDGLLERFAAQLKGCRSQATREQVLRKVIGLAVGG
jgi:DNA topoisomerase-1